MLLQEEIDRLLKKPAVLGAIVISRLGTVISSSFDAEETKAKIAPLKSLLDTASSLCCQAGSSVSVDAVEPLESTLTASNPDTINNPNSPSKSKAFVNDYNLAQNSTAQNSSSNDSPLQFISIKSKLYEVLVCPSDEYVLVTFQKASKLR
ncbi:hypothetical protein BB561_001435 [Smittium simulii]|uniref:Roadblock/LAMTOR2 domain-containing protein n=1 Tax=Smittium simulii TaxID=133385 RepID=A0A2T9YUL0_9FUNG|nr:hypothetical protein BB561_001435 [Smittium simulii]